ncbi:MAG: histidine kinase [Bacteroidota bacterium]
MTIWKSTSLFLIFYCATTLLYSQSNNAIDSLIDLSETKQGLEKVELLESVFAMELSQNPEAAANIAEQLVKIPEQDYKAKAIINDVQIRKHLYISRNHDSLTYWAEKALLNLEDQKDTNPRLTDIYMYLGVSFFYENKIDSATVYYIKATKLAEKSNNTAQLMRGYGGLANVYEISQEIDLARSYRKKAYKLAKENEDFRGQIKLCFNLSASYIRQEQYDSAEVYAEQAVKLSEEIKFNIGLYRSLTKLSECYYNLKEGKKALQAIERAIQMPKNVKDLRYKTFVLYRYAAVLKQNKQYRKAKTVLQQNITLLEQDPENTSAKLLLQDTYYLLGVVYSYLAQSDSTDFYLERAIALSEEITTDQIIGQTAEFQAQYETEKKEQQIKELQQKSKIEQLEVQALQKQRLILGLSLLAPLGFIFAGGWFVNRRRLRLQLEVEQKERAKQLSELKAIRSQMNPHFIFNALNSIQDFILLSEKENAQHYLSKFAVLMRGFLESSRKEKVSLAAEVALLESYRISS